MQKTSLLVAALALFLLLISAPKVLYAQESETSTDLALPVGLNSPELGESKSWGDKKRPENYVPSKAPKKSESPYNGRQMGLAALVMLCMLGFLVWLIRRNTREVAE